MTKPDRKYMELSFLEYIGAEETNLHVTKHNLRTEFDIFTHVDWMYQGAIRRAEVPEDEMMVMQLFLFCHYHLYHTGTTVLRCHLGDAMASARKAIDAALTARRLIDDPNSLQKYIDGHGSFQRITRYFQNQLNEGHYKSERWFIDPLIASHGSYSKAGSHADLAGFSHRIDWGVEGSSEAKLHYFQTPRSMSEFGFYFLSLTKSFLLILNVFENYFVDKKRFVGAPWKNEIRRIGKDIEARARQHKNKYDAEEAASSVRIVTDIS